MASLSNINGLFDVHSTGAILFSTSHGTSGQILRSNGNAAPTWVAASTVIGGPYLPLTGGTLTGATATATGISFTVGGNLFVTGTSTLTGALSGSTGTFTGNLKLIAGASTTYFSEKGYLGDSFNFGTGETTDGVSYTINGAQAGTAGNYFRWLTQTGAATPTEKVRITDEGSLVVGNTPGTNANWGRIQCGGTITVGNSSGTYNAHGRISGDSTSGLRLIGSTSGTYTTTMGITIAGYNVGINTIAPAATLHVDANGGGVLRISRLSASTTNYMQFENDGTNGTIRTEGATIFRAGGSTERMRIASGGETLIGGTSVVADVKLRVVQTANQWVQQIVSTGGGYGLSIDTTSVAHAAAGSLQIYTNSGTGFKVQNNGFVGIGTSSPDYQLDIENSGGAVVRIHAGANSSASLRLKNDAQDWDVNTQTNDTFAIYNQTTGTQPFSILPNGNVGIGVTGPSYKLSVATTLSSGSHLNADFGDENSPTAQFVGQGGNVYDSGGIYRSTVIMAPSSGAITTLFLSTYSSGHWGCQPTFQLKMNGTYYRSGYIEYWCQGIPGSSLKYVIAGPYGTMSDTLSVTVTRLCNTCHGGQPIDRQDWSFTTQGSYLRVSPIIITNKVGRRYFNNSSISALNTLQSSASPIGPAYFFHGLSADQAAGSSNVYTIT